MNYYLMDFQHKRFYVVDNNNHNNKALYKATKMHYNVLRSNQKTDSTCNHMIMSQLQDCYIWEHSRFRDALERELYYHVLNWGKPNYRNEPKLCGYISDAWDECHEVLTSIDDSGDDTYIAHAVRYEFGTKVFDYIVHNIAWSGFRASALFDMFNREWGLSQNNHSCGITFEFAQLVGYSHDLDVCTDTTDGVGKAMIYAIETTGLGDRRLLLSPKFTPSNLAEKLESTLVDIVQEELQS